MEEENPDYRRKLFAILNQDIRFCGKICENGMHIVKKKEQPPIQKPQPILNQQPIGHIDNQTVEVRIL